MDFGDWQAFLDTNTNAYSDLTDFVNVNNFDHLVTSLKQKNIIWSCHWIRNYFEKVNPGHKNHLKSNKKAEGYRKSGNEMFKKKKYQDALLQYDKGILYAESDEQDINKEFALGCANRSAVMYRLGLYNECLTDIAASLSNGYPIELQSKLYIRKAQCYIKLCNLSEGKLAVAKAVDKLDHVEQTKQDSTRKDIESIKKEVYQIKEQEQIKSALQESPTPTYGSDKVIVQASSALELKYTEEQGRHLLARRNIKAGDVIIVEKPYAAVLLPPNYGTHCHHCFTAMKGFYPCTQCLNVQYCSLTCREESWSVYHRVECPYLSLLHSIGIAHLSLRVVLTAGWETLLRFRKTIKQKQNTKSEESAANNEKLIPGLTCEGQYERNYLSVYELMPHADNMAPEDLFQYTMTATLLMHVLENSGYFSRIEQDLLPEIEKLELYGFKTGIHDTTSPLYSIKDYIGGLLLRHICQLVCNAHAITALQTHQVGESKLVDDQTQERIATAIYPTTSLLNHSCTPTIINSFQKDTLVVRVVSDVKAGDQIYNCYGPDAKRMSYEERQHSLKSQYFFTCKCTACLTHGEAEQIYTAFRCPSCSEGALVRESTSGGHCVQCKTQQDTGDMKMDSENLMSQFYQGVELMDKQQYKESLTILKKVLSRQRVLLYKHNRDLAQTHNALAKCYCLLDELTSAVPHLKYSSDVTRIIHGKSSIELAQELDNFANVLVRTKEKAMALQVIQEAIQVFSVNYGEGCENVEVLKHMLWVAQYST